MESEAMKPVGDRTMVTIYLDVGVKRRKEFKSRVGKERTEISL